MNPRSLREGAESALPPLCVAALAFCAFLPALAAGFVNWDDGMWLISNPHYRGLDLAHLRWMLFSRWMETWMPLTWLSYGIDHALWGMRPFGYHLTNVVLHGACAAAVYFLVLGLLDKSLAGGRGGCGARGADGVGVGNGIGQGALLGTRLAAAFAAALFAVHPLRVESVAWASERRDVLSGLFYIMAVHFYLRDAVAPRGAGPQGSGSLQGAAGLRAWARLLPSFAAFVLSLLAKGMGVSVPFVLLILDIHPLGRLPASPRRWLEPGHRAVLLEKLPFLLVALAVGTAGLYGEINVGASMTLTSYGPLQRAAQAFYGAAFYVWKTLMPWGLSPLYVHPGLDVLSPPYLKAAAATCALTALFVGTVRRWPAGLASWAVYLVILFPVIGFIPYGPQVAADRYSYLSCIPWAVLAGWGWAKLWGTDDDAGCAAGSRSLRAALLLSSGALVLALAALTWRQASVWRDSETLWRQALAVAEDNPIAHINLGNELSAQSRLEEALAHYRRALELHPMQAKALNNLGCTLARLGRLDEAAAVFERALLLDPGYAEAGANLARARSLAQAKARAGAHDPAQPRAAPVKMTVPTQDGSGRPE